MTVYFSYSNNFCEKSCPLNYKWLYLQKLQKKLAEQHSMKYPVGIQDFKSIINGGYVYVDKTALIHKLLDEGKIYFLSRPRRFGKSLLVSTLEYYFKGEKELFQGLAIEKLEKNWETYPVFHIDFNSTDFTDGQALRNKLMAYVSEWEDHYGVVPVTGQGVGDRFAHVLEHIHNTTGKRSVVLIDEYDKPLLDVLDTGYRTKGTNGEDILIEEYNRNILKGFYSTFKAADAHLQFVLLTGVTKFSQVSVFSGFNQPADISMSSHYEALCGITEEEMDLVFHEQIDQMASIFKVSPEEMRLMLKRHYDGYHFSEKMEDIYNPFSVLNAFNNERIGDFWFASGTPTYLIRLLNHTQENLNELTGKYYDTSDFVDYRADVERPLPMIYQSGYLTIKAHDKLTNTYLLDFPNNEVKRGFATAIANNYLQSRMSVLTEMTQLVRSLAAADLDALRKQLTAFFASIPYTMRRKDTEAERERYFHYTFYLIFRIISTYLVLTEKQQSEGRADCIIETQNDVYIFEFKLDGTARQALDQIEAMGYARPYAADHRNIHRIGVNFSSKTGTIDDWCVE